MLAGARRIAYRHQQIEDHLLEERRFARVNESEQITLQTAICLPEQPGKITAVFIAVSFVFGRVDCVRCTLIRNIRCCDLPQAGRTH